MPSYQLTLTVPDEAPVRRVVDTAGLREALGELAVGALPRDADLHVAEIAGDRTARSLELPLAA